MKQKAFFMIFKGLSLKQIKQTFLEDESPTLKVQSYKLCNNKYMITSAPITNTEIFTFIAALTALY